MISSKKLIRIARKWQKMDEISTKRSLLPRNPKVWNEDSVEKPSMTNSGHFVIYTVDKQRFLVPLTFLNNHIFVELLRLSEEEFGIPRDGPIVMPCDAGLMRYILLMIRRGLRKDSEHALLNIIASNCSLPCTFITQDSRGQQLVVCK